MTTTEQQLIDLRAENERLRALAKDNNVLARMNGDGMKAARADVARLVYAVEYAHSEGFEWPSDPFTGTSLAALRAEQEQGK